MLWTITAVGFKDSISKLMETQMTDVFSAIEYDVSDTVRSLDSDFYKGLPFETRKSYLERLSTKYKGIGYKGIGALIAFYYNTPNCTIHSVWYSNEGWIPLFPRKHDLNNKSPELYEFDELLKEKTDGQVVRKNDLSIFVEGKTEELFISELAKRNNGFGFKQLKVISIGPFYQKNLLDELSAYSEKVLFLTDDENDSEDNPHNKNLLKAIDNKPLLRIGSIMSYFDMDKVASNQTFSKILEPEIFDEVVSSDSRYTLIETRLFKRAASNFRFNNIRELFDSCINDERLSELVSLINEKTK